MPLPVEDDLRARIGAFYKQGVSGTCIVQVGTKAFTVDKSMLMSNSPVFEAMLTSDMKEAKAGVIKIEDFGADTVERFIEYVYSLHVENLGEVAEDLFVLSDKYEVAELKDRCTKNLIETLSKENVVRRLLLAFMHDGETFKGAVLDYVTKADTDADFTSILMSDEWQESPLKSKELANEIMKAVFAKTELVLKPQEPVEA